MYGKYANKIDLRIHSIIIQMYYQIGRYTKDRLSSKRQCRARLDIAVVHYNLDIHWLHTYVSLVCEDNCPTIFSCNKQTVNEANNAFIRDDMHLLFLTYRLNIRVNPYKLKVHVY